MQAGRAALGRKNPLLPQNSTLYYTRSSHREKAMTLRLPGHLSPSPSAALPLVLPLPPVPHLLLLRAGSPSAWNVPPRYSQGPSSCLQGPPAFLAAPPPPQSTYCAPDCFVLL